ncbi:MAG: flavodoxin-dependent (E)-4-hydroxy-3-methylbut-2-enyl-diphosphate synthase [Clostridiales bacterium]|nr:flavodoxin-dependent (E)-4-hydroxy-3-methylbut-2-enyl-diphosphate synthase [Clostridiales bacterium]MDD7036081.1 flavodoxin-dependent (E)-4-hydroxy-3-methylbut-2-enyl-diphosphate synthase [Bacillota bacterium]MDY2920833.1 flavodoxin-dependent (E)-4-hydroxy-3-methylbut-2-enyl-diphosphate synthase [Lentihominibacter sp.]
MKKQVKVGNINIGGDAPVSIQSMCNTATEDVESTVAQLRRLENAGCEIARLTVPSQEAVEAFAVIKQQVDIPLVADIHFDYRLAIGAIDAGADKIRINPGNIGGEDKIRQVAEKAGDAGIPIRVGVNSGSLERDIIEANGGVTAEGLAESAMRNVALLEKCGFEDIVVSLKSSDVKMNCRAYRLVDGMCDYPLHIGVTEAGTPEMGRIKSAAGLGALLLDGIGDTMRVSLTADPVEEVVFARKLLEATGLRQSDFEIVSCPTCGRTQVDLEKLANEAERRLTALYREKQGLRRGLKVAVMGCAVNGPGEAAGADIGVACGRGEGLLFTGGRTVRKVPEEDIVNELIRMAEEYSR